MTDDATPATTPSRYQAAYKAGRLGELLSQVFEVVKNHPPRITIADIANGPNMWGLSHKDIYVILDRLVEVNAVSLDGGGSYRVVDSEISRQYAQHRDAVTTKGN